jgi:hypothetical protein
MMKPRWLAKFLASLGGYFWLPCPICGEPFAGFEWGHDDDQTLMQTLHSGKGVCPKAACKSETRRRNEELYARLGLSRHSR